jgi:hypothetical protein
MSNYTKSTNFATKDNLPTGDPLKIVKGTEIDTEYNNIATAIATKTDNASAAITGGTITGITDLAVADGGTGASTAAGALNNLLPSQTSAANKYLQSDGTNASWDAVTLSTSDITGTLAVANGGTGVTSSTGTGSTVLSNSPTLVTPTLGTPASATLTNATGLPISTGVSGLGTGVATALAVNTGSAGAPVLFNGALGTPSSGTVTNLTGTASININGTVGSVGPASGSFTTLTSSSTVTINGGTANGIGYLNASKVFTTGTVLKFDGTNITSDRSSGTAYSGTSFSTWANGIILNNSATPATGLLDSIYFTNNANMQNVFGVAQNASGYGDFVWAGYAGSYTEWMKLTSAGLSITGTLGVTGVATLGAGAILNTPASVTLTNATGLPLTTGTTGTLATSKGGTNLTSFTSGGVVYASSSSALATGSALTFNGSTLGLSATTATVSVKSTGTGSNASVSIDNTGTDVASLLTLNINGSTTAYIGSGGATYPNLGGNNSLFLWNSANGPIVFASNNSEKMRIATATGGVGAVGIGYSSLTSVGDNGLAVLGNVGIGTSSPLFKLQSNGTVARKYITAGTSGSPAEEAGFIYADDTSTPVAGMWFYNAFSSNSATQLSFKTRTSGGTVTEALRIDASQNVGIGTSSPNAKLDVVGGNMAVLSNTAATAATASTYALWVGNSATRDMTLGSDATYAYIQSWSGKPLYINSQGNNVLFGSGNVGIGTSSPVTSLDVRATNGATIIAGRTANTGTGSEFGYFASYAPNASGTDIIWSQIKSLVSTATAGSEANSIVFSSRTAGSFTEKLRIDSSGNLLVGQTTQVNGEKLGVTSSSNTFLVKTTGNNSTARLTYVTQSTGTTVYDYYICNSTNTGTISTNGTTTSYNLTSDQRLKQNIQDADSASSLIDSLQVRKFDWKSDNSHQRYGFIAQELLTVAPEAVYQPTDTNEMMAVDYSKLVPMLVKEIQSLRQRLSAANL